MGLHIDSVTPAYFGLPGEELFGCFHEPQKGAGKSIGIVLCYPTGRDYIFAHRAFRQLAIRLARAGFPVLRFDYFGCGDSAGDGSEGSVDRWTSDITIAIDELKARSSATRVCLLGFRLGASLAVLSGTRLGNIEGLVLWDPVIDGVAFVDSLIESHVRWSQLPVWAPKALNRGGPQDEILGFPVTRPMLTGMQGIALDRIAVPPAQRVLLISSADTVELDGFGRYLEAMGIAVDLQRMAWQEYWIGSENLADVLMPPVRILQSVVSWASGAWR